MSEITLELMLRRDRAVVIAALAALTTLAWAYIVWLTANMSMHATGPASMAMDAGSDMNMNMNMNTMSAMLAPAFKPWNMAHFIFMVTMWIVMMIGMMTPSAAPMILIYARVGRQAALHGRPFASTGFFAGGYLLAWTVFSLVATLGQWMLERAALLTPMMAITSDILGGLVLLAAGIFQWTALKDACLQHCQAPLAFIQKHGGFQRKPWRSLNLGFQHGIYCIGCCWALMTLLFVGGIMNLLWIAMLTIFVLLEKIVPAGRWLTRIAGLGFMLWGTLLIGSALG